MKANIIELQIIFDELLTPPTDEELGVYWFEIKREDNLTIVLSFSIYEDYAGLLVQNEQEIAITNLNMKNCAEIRVLDEKKNFLKLLMMILKVGVLYLFMGMIF